VADTAIRIVTEVIDRILNAFEQIKDAYSGHIKGAGLVVDYVRGYLDLLQVYFLS
jgi:hypothetical protein